MIGSKDEQFFHAHRIISDLQDNVYVTYGRVNCQVSVFGSNGKFLKMKESEGKIKPIYP